MIISEYVILGKPRGRIYNYYKNLGYDISGDTLKVSIFDLSKSSRKPIKVKCDYCFKEKDIPYRDYLKSLSKNNKYSCSFCIDKKRSEINLEKWGVENVFQLKEVKEKIKKYNQEKYGLDYHTQSDEIKEKIKKSVKKNWGVDNVSMSSIIKKIKNKKLLEKIENDYKRPYKIDSDENHIKHLGNSEHLFKCRDHHFLISKDNYFSRRRLSLSLCTVCNPIGDSQSIKEKDLFDFINSIYSGKIIQSHRDGLEIDIYLPELKLGFEFNGLYWHSEKHKDKFYHINKTKWFNERDIRIIHIWEDDWDNRRSILESQIKNWLGLTENKIFARKCEVREIKNSKEVTKFLKENHIQGRVGSSLKLGLYYEDELFSLMTFDHLEGRNKMRDCEWNINRFCNRLNYNVIGGASKLFKYFLSNFEVSRVISYTDRDWSLGGLYKTLGFVKINENDPDYKYLLKENRVHKSRFRKSKTNLTESKLNLQKVWDCGKIKYEFNHLNPRRID